jgi:hypothetical protein
MATINTLNVSQRTLSRVASRVIHVARQHEHNPALRAPIARVVPTALAYTDACEAAKGPRIRRGNSVKKCRVKSQALAKRLRTWISSLSSELEFEPSEFTPTSPVPGDVVVVANSFVAYLESIAAKAPDMVPPDAITSLKEGAADTLAEWSENQSAAAEAQAMEQVVRDRGLEFHNALVVFRRALANVVGKQHVDYRTLRYHRARNEDGLDIVVEETRADVTADVTPVPAPVADGSSEDRESGEFHVPLVAVAG